MTMDTGKQLKKKSGWYKKKKILKPVLQPAFVLICKHAFETAGLKRNVEIMKKTFFDIDRLLM